MEGQTLNPVIVETFPRLVLNVPVFVLRSPPQLVLFVEDDVLFSLWTRHSVSPHCYCTQRAYSSKSKDTVLVNVELTHI